MTSLVFKSNAQAFSEYFSSLLTTTITYQPLKCYFIGGANVAVIRFGRGRKYIGLGNGASISVSHTVIPNPDYSGKVRTTGYSYSYSLGPNPDTDWLIRYDYVPDKKGDPKHPYPISHVHVNATNEFYNRFMETVEEEQVRSLSEIHFPSERITLEDFIEHLVVEFQVPPLYGQTVEEVREMLAESREGFQQRRTDYDK